MNNNTYIKYLLIVGAGISTVFLKGALYTAQFSVSPSGINSWGTRISLEVTNKVADLGSG